MKKILFILSSSSPFGGSTKSLEIILKQMEQERDYHFGIVLPDTTGVYKEWIGNGWKVYVAKNQHCNYPPLKSTVDFILFSVRFIWHYMVNKRAEHAIEQIVKAEAFDTIYTNVGVLNVGYNVAHRNGLIHIYHLREYQDLDFGERIYPSFQEFSRKIAQKKNYNIAITKGIYQYFHCPSKNSVVIYNGVMNKDDYKTIIWDKQKYFLFVGRLSDGKGVIDAIEAFNVVCHNYPDYKLVLAGGVESKKMEIQIRNKVAQYGLTDSIQFLGMVHHVDELMRKAKALLMCSRSEGLGRVTIEAMANGCLVIGKNAMGTKEQFDNGLAFTGHEIGLRYDTLDELECNMMNVIKNGTDSYKDMIHNAQDTVFHYYTIERCYNSLVNFFQKIEHENP